MRDKNITGVKLLFTDDIKNSNGRDQFRTIVSRRKYLKNLNIRIAEGNFREGRY